MLNFSTKLNFSLKNAMLRDVEELRDCVLKTTGLSHLKKLKKLSLIVVTQIRCYGRTKPRQKSCNKSRESLFDFVFTF